MRKTAQFALIMLVLLALTPALFGGKKKEQPVQHAPLSAKVLTAKSIYIQNDSGYAEIADQTYAALMKWGRYQIVDAKEKADLVLVLTVIAEQSEGTQGTWTNTYDWTTGKTKSTQGSAPSFYALHYTQMTLADRATGETAWTDRRKWWHKHHPTEELVDALRQRVAEQKENPQR